MSQTLKFRYRPKRWVFVLCTVFFGGGAFVLADIALQGTKSLEALWGLITLPPAQAVYGWWALTGVSALFAAVGAFAVIMSVLRPAQVILGETTLSAPTRLWRKHQTVVPLATIFKVHLSEIQGQGFLTITHVSGKMTLQRQMFRSKAEFNRFQTELKSRLPALRL